MDDVGKRRGAFSWEHVGYKAESELKWKQQEDQITSGYKINENNVKERWNI